MRVSRYGPRCPRPFLPRKDEGGRAAGRPWLFCPSPQFVRKQPQIDTDSHRSASVKGSPSLSGTRLVQGQRLGEMQIHSLIDDECGISRPDDLFDPRNAVRETVPRRQKTSILKLRPSLLQGGASWLLRRSPFRRPSSPGSPLFPARSLSWGPGSFPSRCSRPSPGSAGGWTKGTDRSLRVGHWVFTAPHPQALSA